MRTLHILRPSGIGTISGRAPADDPGWSASTNVDPAPGGDVSGSTDDDLLRGLSNYTGAEFSAVGLSILSPPGSGTLQYVFDATTPIFVLDGAAPVSLEDVPGQDFVIESLTFGLFFNSDEDPVRIAGITVTVGGVPMTPLAFDTYIGPGATAAGYRYLQALAAPINASTFITQTIELTYTAIDGGAFISYRSDILPMAALLDGTYSSVTAWWFNPTANRYVFAAESPGEPFVASDAPTPTITGVDPRFT